MPIFGPSDEEKERIKRQADEAAARYEKRYGPVPEEPGIEELELEEAVPGGAFIGSVSPKGVAKGGFTAMRKLGKELAKEAEEVAAKKGTKVLSKMVDKIPEPLNYKAMKDVERAEKFATEARAPVLDYSKPAMKKTREELEREAKRKKIKQTGFRYEGGEPIED